jgi:acyl-CoA reductase-like NAD-dependent aldehyde dehydrogenase
MDSVNPATGATIASFEEMSGAEVESIAGACAAAAPAGAARRACGGRRRSFAKTLHASPS